MKKIAILLMIYSVAMVGWAQQSSAIQLTKELHFECMQLPVNGQYSIDISNCQLGGKSAAEVFAGISLPYAKFVVDQSGQQVSLTINTDGYRKVSQWNLAQWQNHFSILSKRIRLLAGHTKATTREDRANRAKAAKKD